MSKRVGPLESSLPRGEIRGPLLSDSENAAKCIMGTETPSTSTQLRHYTAAATWRSEPCGENAARQEDWNEGEVSA